MNSMKPPTQIIIPVKSFWKKLFTKAIINLVFELIFNNNAWFYSNFQY